jgi:agmatine deiminase
VQRQPAEWTPHQALWSAWPSHADLWEENLDPARAELAALFHAAARAGETLHIAVHGDGARASATTALEGTGATLHDMPFGDIWFRDTAPIFALDENGVVAVSYKFNGWGGKYILPDDAEVSMRVASAARTSTGYGIHHTGWVLEGGSIDVDGTGWALTTEQCLLNPNRNPGYPREDIVRQLHEELGIDHLVWLGDGLANDHTDGHIDNLARFVSPGVVIVPEARDGDDPNRDVYLDARRRLEFAGLQVVVAPSVGRLENDGGELIPASYMNFLVTNTAVIVPVYGTKWDDMALKEMQPVFPGREIVGLRANHVISGGGSFHCITQQVPAWPVQGA